MIRIDDAAPTECEMKRGTISKNRYLEFRDCRSTTRKLKFRIEGVRLATGEQMEKEYLNRWVLKSYFLKVFTRLRTQILVAKVD